VFTISVASSFLNIFSSLSIMTSLCLSAAAISRTSLRYRCTLLHFMALYCTLLHFIALYCTLLHFIALYFDMFAKVTTEYKIENTILLGNVLRTQVRALVRTCVRAFLSSLACSSTIAAALMLPSGCKTGEKFVTIIVINF